MPLRKAPRHGPLPEPENNAPGLELVLGSRFHKEFNPQHTKQPRNASLVHILRLRLTQFAWADVQRLFPQGNPLSPIQTTHSHILSDR